MDSQSGPTAAAVEFDPAALIRDHQAGVWRYLRVLGCGFEEASDLTQETFLLFLQRPFVAYSEAATGAYLRKIAHNLLISLRRREGRVRVVENIEELNVAWDRWGRIDDGQTALEALKECAKKLTERARLALDMRFRDQASRESIAAQLKITTDGVKNLMQRAKQQLRACVESKLK